MRSGDWPEATTRSSTGGSSSASRERIAMASRLPVGAQTYFAARSMKARMFSGSSGAWPITSSTDLSLRLLGTVRSRQTTPITSRGPSGTTTKLPGGASAPSGSS